MSAALSIDSGPNTLSYRVVSTLATLLGTCIVSFCLGQRTYTFDVFSRRGLSSMTVSRFWLLFLLVDSLFFLVGSGILLQDIGLNQNLAACTIAESFCISFYFISKGAAYFLFLEKVYAVWPNRGSRITSTAYRVGFVALAFFLSLLVVCILGREAYIRDDGQCMIGTHDAVTLTVLLVDVAVNALLTSLFLVPLMRRSKLSPQIREVAMRNFIAATCCFLSSAANMAAITAMQGHEVAWLCVASCSADICINAIIAFWVTRPPSRSDTGSEGPSHHTWRVATRNMDADEAILSRFEAKTSFRLDPMVLNDRRMSKSHPGFEVDSSSMHETFTEPETKSFPGVTLPVPSRARTGSVARLLSPIAPRSPPATSLRLPKPKGASEPNTPTYELSRKFSLSVPGARGGPYQNLDAHQDGTVSFDEPGFRSRPGRPTQYVVEDAEQESRGHAETEYGGETLPRISDDTIPV